MNLYPPFIQVYNHFKKKILHEYFRVARVVCILRNLNVHPYLNKKTIKLIASTFYDKSNYLQPTLISR